MPLRLPSLRWSRLTALLLGLAVVASVAGTTGGPSRWQLTAAPDNYTMQASTSCDTSTGQHQVLWTVKNWIRSDPLYLLVESSDQFRFLSTPGGTEQVLTNSVVSIPAATGDVVQTYWGTEPGLGYLLQRVPGTATRATFGFTPSYHGGAGSPDSASTTLSGQCRIDGQADVRFVHGCDGTVMAETTNTTPDSNPVEVSVRAANGFSASFELAAQEQRDVIVPAANARGVTVTSPTGRFGPVDWRLPSGCGAEVDGPAAACTSDGGCESPQPTPAVSTAASPTPSSDAVSGAAFGGRPADLDGGRPAFILWGTSLSFAVLVLLAVMSLFVFRRQRPDRYRPSRHQGPPRPPPLAR